MSLDELALSAQRAVDRLIRRLRRAPPRRPRIGGSSSCRSTASRARCSTRRSRRGACPFSPACSSVTTTGWSRWRSGLPTSTAAFHMAAMYGVRPDIPGFHYYDRRAPWRYPLPEAGARRGGRGQAGGGASGHPARRQRLRLCLHGRRRQQPLQLRQPHPAQGASVLTALSAFVVAGLGLREELGARPSSSWSRAGAALHRGSARRGRHAGAGSRSRSASRCGCASSSRWRCAAISMPGRRRST